MRNERRQRNQPCDSLRAPSRSELSILIAAILGTTATAEPAVAREVPFHEPPAIGTEENSPRDVFTADIDGDGDIDALSASLSGDRIAWYENGGEGDGWARHTIGAGINGANSVHATDVDGDGDIDALSASLFDNLVAWYENDGTGFSWSTHTISTSGDGASSVYSADLDGDGDVDVVSASFNDSTVAWHENDGTGSAWTTHVISTTAQYAFSVFAADMDGDGDVDVLSASQNDDKVAWYENDGTGGTWDPHTITSSANDATSVFVADMDADGDLDALSASIFGGLVAWYENDGAGGGWSVHTITTGDDDARSVMAIDVDGDGDIDALSAISGIDRFAWHENDGTGGGWTTHTIATAGEAWSITGADLDGDGDSDVLGAAAGAHTVTWYRNDTIHRSGRFPEQQVVSTAGDAPQSVTTADLDGDGNEDAISASFSNDLLAWHENDGTPADGGWTTRTIATNATALRWVQAADLDKDGDQDLVIASSNDNLVAWYENDGTPLDGGWVTHTVTTSAVFPWSVHPADVDRDGNLDLLVASRDDDSIAWHQSDGTPADGGWVVRTITASADGALSVVAGDLDRDGDVDVVSASRDDSTIAWHENDGTPLDGGWITHTISANALDAQAVVLGDLDLDGDLDVVSASRQDGKVAWYENDGSPGDGGWTTHTVSTLAVNTFTVDAGDVDNDGDVDVISASAVNDQIIWFENDGTPADGGWKTYILPGNPDFPEQVYMSDLDGEGDLDLLAVSGDDDTVAWYENRGGQFGLPTLTTAQKIVNNASTHDLLDIEAAHRGRMGDSDAELAAIELRLSDSSGNPLNSAQADNLIEELRIHLDDGSGTFDGSPTDAVVHTVSSFSLSAGVETIPFSDGNANAQLPFGLPKIYFVVADITSDADIQTPSAFRVTHVTESSSTGEDAAADIPLILEFWPDTGTGVVDTALSTASCEAPFDLLLADRSVDFTLTCEAGTLLSAENFDLTGSADVTFRSGDTVTLLPGFSVQAGQFAVQIDPELTP